MTDMIQDLYIQHILNPVIQQIQISTTMEDESLHHHHIITIMPKIRPYLQHTTTIMLKVHPYHRLYIPNR